jgi:hypothetical protein
MAWKLLVNSQHKWFQEQTDPTGNRRSHVLADDDKQTGRYFEITYESPPVASMAS